jgi:aspartate kinase
MVRIFKFGGASVQNHIAIENLKKILDNYQQNKMVIVISAMGKTTVALEKIALLSYDNDDYAPEWEQLKKMHIETCKGLIEEVPTRLYELFEALELKLANPYGKWVQFLDQVAAYGELFSTTIIAAYLANFYPVMWMDARKLICSDTVYGGANVNWEKTIANVQQIMAPELSKHMVVTQGYIAGDDQGNTTTLGKEGSDYTAAVLAHCLNADAVTVWKDVAGILNADPKRMPEASLFPKLTYQEITEMTYYGAKVIHPKTMAPLAEKGIPLFVKSFQNPEGQGTHIHAGEHEAYQIPSFIYKDAQILLTLRPLDHKIIDLERLTHIFQIVSSHHINLNLMQHSALTYSICFDYNEAQFEALKRDLLPYFKLGYNFPLSLATIKHYTEDDLQKLPVAEEILLEQKTRTVYQRLYRLNKSS